jgi:hypothetical protein
MPVFGPGGAIVAALGITATDPGRVRAMFAPVSVAARSLSRELATTGAPEVFFCSVVRPPPGERRLLRSRRSGAT